MIATSTEGYRFCGIWINKLSKEKRSKIVCHEASHFNASVKDGTPAHQGLLFPSMLEKPAMGSSLSPMNLPDNVGRGLNIAAGEAGKMPSEIVLEAMDQFGGERPVRPFFRNGRQVLRKELDPTFQSTLGCPFGQVAGRVTFGHNGPIS